MIAEIQYNDHKYKIDLSNSLDISIPLKAEKSNVTAYYVDVPKFEPVMANGFVGAVNLGGSVNFNNIFFNPHGNGTHTECVGHISKEKYTINQCLKEFFFLANVVSVTPIQIGNDAVITLEQIQKVWHKNSLSRPFGEAKAVVIRTLPNQLEKLTKQYTNQNPAFIDYRAVQFLVDNGVEHLLIDTPSIDKEEDGGALLAHRTFWEYPTNTKTQRTVTELIFVPDFIKDGTYFLNIQIASFENDASPSKPILFAILS